MSQQDRRSCLLIELARLNLIEQHLCVCVCVCVTSHRCTGVVHVVVRRCALLLKVAFYV